MDGMYYQLFAADLHARYIYPQIKKYFYKKTHSKLTWEEFLTLTWEYTHLSTDSTLGVDLQRQL